MSALKLVHHKDLLKCNHGGVVNLEPTEERFTDIQADLRLVTDLDLRGDKVMIQHCPKKPDPCVRITDITVGLSRDIELSGGAIPVLRNLEAVTDQQGIVKWYGFEMDIDAAVKRLDKHTATNDREKNLPKAESKSVKLCASYVKSAIREGGKDGGMADAGGTVDALDMGPKLEDVGFQSLPSDAAPQKGDVVVFDGVPPDHAAGHTAMWDGKQWVSDFKQQGIVVNEVYRNKTPKFYRSAGRQAHAGPK